MPDTLGIIPFRASVEASNAAFAGVAALVVHRRTEVGKNGSLPSFTFVGRVKTEWGISGSAAVVCAGAGGLEGPAKAAKQNAAASAQAAQVRTLSVFDFRIFIGSFIGRKTSRPLRLYQRNYFQAETQFFLLAAALRRHGL